MSAGAIVGISFAVVVVVGTLVAALIVVLRKRSNAHMHRKVLKLSHSRSAVELNRLRKAV